MLTSNTGIYWAYHCFMFLFCLLYNPPAQIWKLVRDSSFVLAALNQNFFKVNWISDPKEKEIVSKLKQLLNDLVSRRSNRSATSEFQIRV